MIYTIEYKLNGETLLFSCTGKQLMQYSKCNAWEAARFMVKELGGRLISVSGRRK